jgi:hypothetical protein
MAKGELADFENPERNRGWYPITTPSFAENEKKNCLRKMIEIFWQYGHSYL